ncbi:MAG: hypothetical protein OXC53_08710 [Rhodobacteraceae bacterium]|nr:hypothetical protein [Gammaproteobacteria bacterium]MCY4327651.1 hypothetical protein [Paracoccaceae bacterium]
MSNSQLERAALAQAAFELTPPLIRQGLIDEAAFREEYEVSTDPVLTFHHSGLSVQRSNLFGAVRKVLGGTQGTEVSDTSGRDWQIQSEGMNEEPNLVACSGELRQPLPDFLVLSPNRKTRQRFLNEKALDVNLPPNDRARWENFLEKRPLGDEEVEILRSELQDTPAYFLRSARDWTKESKIDALSLVPHSNRYFERLVGAFDGSKSIMDYASGPGKALLNNLTTWQPVEGFLHSLLLSGHPALTDQIEIAHLSSQEMIEAYELLEQFGGVVSKLGAVEVGLRNLRQRPEIEPFLVRLIEAIQNDDIDADQSECESFTSLFVLVDGQISSLRLLAKATPYYRRLVAFAQAELVRRALVQIGINHHDFARRAVDARGMQHYMQSFCDMRLEPCWNPHFGMAQILKMNFLGRINSAAESWQHHVGEGKLRSLVLGPRPRSQLASAHFPLSGVPSPLEGRESQSEPLAEDQLRSFKEQFDKLVPSPLKLLNITSCLTLFKVDADIVERTARALSSWSNNGFTGLEDRSQLLDILYGLANVAARTRNHFLANKIRACIRTACRDKQIEISAQEATGILLTAAASRSGLSDWREFVGESMVELAFDELSVDEAQYLYSCIRHLLHVVPDLWHSCSKAEAALKALIGSQP